MFALTSGRDYIVPTLLEVSKHSIKFRWGLALTQNSHWDQWMLSFHQVVLSKAMDNNMTIVADFKN